MIRPRPSTNTKPAALRKVGVEAYIKYAVMGIITLIYYWFVSHPRFIDAFGSIPLISTDRTNAHLGMLSIFTAMLFACMYFFTIPRYGLLSMPLWVNKTYIFILVLSLNFAAIASLGRTDITDFIANDTGYSIYSIMIVVFISAVIMYRKKVWMLNLLFDYSIILAVVLFFILPCFFIYFTCRYGFPFSFTTYIYIGLGWFGVMLIGGWHAQLLPITTAIPFVSLAVVAYYQPYWLWRSFFVVAIPFMIFSSSVIFIIIKEWIKEHPRYREWVLFGVGGAARFGGIFTFYRYDFTSFLAGREHKKAPIYAGRTKWFNDPRIGGREIGLDSESHMLTIAMTGGGKSLYVAWNTLLRQEQKKIKEVKKLRPPKGKRNPSSFLQTESEDTGGGWSGGCFVLDPKGEHAQLTATNRRKAGHRVIILDPWNITQKGNSDGFNPLAEINPKSINARDDLMQIVQGSIVQDAKEMDNSRHFREASETILIGIIAHVLSTFPEEYHNLPSVYDTLLTGDPDGGAADPTAFKDLVNDMATNEAMGRAPMDAAKLLKEAGQNEGGGFITTTAIAINWVNTPALRPFLMKSSFKMSDMKLKRATVYLVVPLEYVSKHKRFLRTVINLALLSTREGTKDQKTLFLLDEVAHLGMMKPIKEGLNTLRAQGVKLWVFFQDMGQLKDIYSNWNSFISACDKQFFAVNDNQTATFIHETLGKYVDRWQEGIEGQTRHIEKDKDLRSVSDILEELKEGSKTQYVLPSDGNPMILKCVPFFKRFSKKQYGEVLPRPAQLELEDDEESPRKPLVVDKSCENEKLKTKAEDTEDLD